MAITEKNADTGEKTPDSPPVGTDRALGGVCFPGAVVLLCVQLCSGIFALSAQNDLPRSLRVPVLQKKHLLSETRESQGPRHVDGECNHSAQLLLPSGPGRSYSWPRGGTRASLAVPGPRASPSALGPPPGRLAWVLCCSAQAGICCFLPVAELAESSGT